MFFAAGSLSRTLMGAYRTSPDCIDGFGEEDGVKMGRERKGKGRGNREMEKRKGARR